MDLWCKKIGEFKVKNIAGGYKSASTLNFKLAKIEKPKPDDRHIDPDTQTVKCN
jgi:hypothetical protein